MGMNEEQREFANNQLSLYRGMDDLLELPNAISKVELDRENLAESIITFEAIRAVANKKKWIAYSDGYRTFLKKNRPFRRALGAKHKIPLLNEPIKRLNAIFEETVFSNLCKNLKSKIAEEQSSRSSSTTGEKTQHKNYPRAKRPAATAPHQSGSSSSATGPTQKRLRTATADRPAAPAKQDKRGGLSSATEPTHKKTRTATANRPTAPVQQPQSGSSSSAAGPTQKRLRTAESSDPRIGLYDPKNPYRPTDENGIFTLFPVVDKKEIIKSIMRSPYAR